MQLQGQPAESPQSGLCRQCTPPGRGHRSPALRVIRRQRSHGRKVSVSQPDPDPLPAPGSGAQPTSLPAASSLCSCPHLHPSILALVPSCSPRTLHPLSSPSCFPTFALFVGFSRTGLGPLCSKDVGGAILGWHSGCPVLHEPPPCQGHPCPSLAALSAHPYGWSASGPRHGTRVRPLASLPTLTCQALWLPRHGLQAPLSAEYNPTVLSPPSARLATQHALPLVGVCLCPTPNWPAFQALFLQLPLAWPPPPPLPSNANPASHHGGPLPLLPRCYLFVLKKTLNFRLTEKV